MSRLSSTGMGDSGPSSAERRDAGIRAARALGDSRNYRGAVDRLRQVLGEDPEHVEAHYLLGLFLHNLGRPAEAVAACRAGVAAGSDDAIAHRLLGIVLGAGRWTKAEGLAHLDEAVRLAPTDGFNHYYRARALVGLSRPRLAKAAYLEACDRAPTEPQILAGTAEFLFATCEVRKAQALAARAFAAAPDDLGALTAEARSLLFAGRAADARDLARAAVAILPSHSAALALLIEAEMCRNPVYAAWSRLKNWAAAGRWRRGLLLLAAIQLVSGIFGTTVANFPDDPWMAITAFAVCLALPVWPGILFRRRLGAALKPVRLGERF